MIFGIIHPTQTSLYKFQNLEQQNGVGGCLDDVFEYILRCVGIIFYSQTIGWSIDIDKTKLPSPRFSQKAHKYSSI